MKLLYDRVMVRELEGERLTRGGLHIPDVALDGTPYIKAEVIAVGHGRILQGGGVEPLQIRVGDIVAWFKGGDSVGRIVAWPSADPREKLWIIHEPSIAVIFEAADIVESSGIVSAEGSRLVAS